jgi:glycosyl hydrolase family 12
MRFSLALLAVAACGGGHNATIDGRPGDSAGAHDGQVSDSGIGDAGIAGMACTNPTFVTSSMTGGENDGGYYIFNNMWNTSVPLGPETLSACSYHSWYVVSNQTSSAGAVKTYPNVQMNFNDVPISSLTTIASTFAETSPHVGIYEDAYDIWTNGIATNGSTEFMIWVDNYNQVPAGDKVTTMTFGGRSYDVWKTSDNSYIAFVATTSFTSGSIDLLAIFAWTITQGWLPSTSTLSQIDFGAEICSTNGADATFQFTDFSITAS